MEKYIYKIGLVIEWPSDLPGLMWYRDNPELYCSR